MARQNVYAAIDFLKIPEQGSPYLEGHACGNCDAIFLGERSTCCRCGSRDNMQLKTLANTGSLYAFSIVYRSFPGVEVS